MISSRRLRKLNECFATGPCVAAALHCSVAEVGVAGDAGVVQDLLLDRDGPLEELRVPVGETDPLGLALEEAEVAAGSSAPFVVVGQPDAGVVEDLA